MAGFGTAKVQTTALNIGMPTAFGNAYARFGPTEEYMPSANLRGSFPAGNDFQSKWHEQKMRDAHAMANAKVHSTTMMNTRANSAHAGYYRMPKAVLGQRKFANPSMGAGIVWSSRWDGDESPWTFGNSALGTFGSGRMVGGVLRSAPGQAYGKARLNARVEQFNRIAKSREEFLANPMSDRLPEAFAGAEPTFAQQVGTLPKVELSNILNSILSNIVSGNPLYVLRSVSETFRAFSLIVQLAVNNPPSDLENIAEFIDGTSAVDGIIPSLEALSETLGEINDDDSAEIQTQILLLHDFWGKVNKYLKAMLKDLDSKTPLRTRKAKSDALIKSFELDKPQRITDPRIAQVLDDDDESDNFPGDDEDGGDGAYDEDGDGEEDGTTQAGTSSSSSSGRKPPRTKFVPLKRREDAEHGHRGRGGQTFSSNNRNTFAKNSGKYLDQTQTGGRPVEYFAGYDNGDEGLEDEAELGLRDGGDDGEEVGAMTAGLQPGGLSVLPSAKDGETGEYDVRVSKPSAKSSAAAATSRRPYTAGDVPYTLDEIIQFLHRVETEHGVNIGVYGKKGAKISNIRKNIKNRLKKEKLME